MARVLSTLYLHGFGYHRSSNQESIRAGTITLTLSPDKGLAFSFACSIYDPAFKNVYTTFNTAITALWELARSGASQLSHLRNILPVLASRAVAQFFADAHNVALESQDGTLFCHKQAG